MIVLLLILLSILIVVVFLCSLTEAAVLSVPVFHVRHLSEQGSRRAKALLELKEQPAIVVCTISVIRIFTTVIVLLVGGVVLASVELELLAFGIAILIVCSLLLVTEIFPKKLGVVYAKQISLQVSFILKYIIRLLAPINWLLISGLRLIKGLSNLTSETEANLGALTEIGTGEKEIDQLEGSIIKNVIGLDRRLVKDILTPRVVVFRLPENIPLSEVKLNLPAWNHTRVPIFAETSPDVVNRYVIQRDLYRSILKGELDKQLSDFARPLSTVPELMQVDKLLTQMFEHGEYLCSVVDEHGGFAGLVTFEDIIEELVGREIIDEYDLVGDLRSYAQILHHARRRRLSADPESGS